MKILVFLLIFICIWIICVEFSVISKRNKAVNSFKELDAILQERYKVLRVLLSSIRNNNILPNTAIEYSESLLSEVLSLGTAVENIDRRIVFDRELAQKTEEIIFALIENPNFQNNPEIKAELDEYDKFKQSVNKAIEKYNTNAHILKLAADTFPSSFMARLSRIKFLDSI